MIHRNALPGRRFTEVPHRRFWFSPCSATDAAALAQHSPDDVRRFGFIYSALKYPEQAVDLECTDNRVWGSREKNLWDSLQPIFVSLPEVVTMSC